MRVHRIFIQGLLGFIQGSSGIWTLNSVKDHLILSMLYAYNTTYSKSQKAGRYLSSNPKASEKKENQRV